MDEREVDLKSGKRLCIREARPKDASAVLAYIEVVSRETDFLTFGPGEFELDEAGEADHLRVSASSPIQLYLLAFIDGGLVGSLHFAARDRVRVRHVGELGMSVLERCWGQGIGSHLMDALIAWARASGIITKIDLQVRPDNTRAIALYQRKGFGIEGTLRKQMRVDGSDYDLHSMGLDLECEQAS